MSNSGQVRSNRITIGAIHTNTEQTLIQITEDRLRLGLMQHLAVVEARKRWQVPMGMLLALVPVLLTSEFKDAWGMDKATWRAIFIIFTTVATFWLALEARAAFKSTTIDELIRKLKN